MQNLGVNWMNWVLSVWEWSPVLCDLSLFSFYVNTLILYSSAIPYILNVHISSVGFYWVIVICTVFIYNIYNHILCFYKIIVVWMRVRDVCSRIHLGGSGCSWYSIGACKTPWRQFQGETVPNTVCPSLVLLVLCVFCSNILYVSRLMLREYWSCGNLISIAFHRRMSRLQVI